MSISPEGFFWNSCTGPSVACLNRFLLDRTPHNNSSAPVGESCWNPQSFLESRRMNNFPYGLPRIMSKNFFHGLILCKCVYRCIPVFQMQLLLVLFQSSSSNSKCVHYNTAVLCFESISSNLRSVNYGQYLTLDFSPLPLPLNSMLGRHVARIERTNKK